MITVHKFPFLITDATAIDMPIGAEILLVECQNQQPCIWAKVDNKAKTEKRMFVITGTGHEVPGHCKHVASFQQGMFVWHLWEIDR